MRKRYLYGPQVAGYLPARVRDERWYSSVPFLLPFNLFLTVIVASRAVTVAVAISSFDLIFVVAFCSFFYETAWRKTREEKRKWLVLWGIVRCLPLPEIPGALEVLSSLWIGPNFRI